MGRGRPRKTEEEKIARKRAYEKEYYKTYRRKVNKERSPEEKEKIRKRLKAYYKANKEEIRQKSRQYYLKNRDKLIAKAKAYNKERYIPREKRSRKKVDKKIYSEYQREYRAKNAETIKEYFRKHYEKRREQAKIKQRKILTERMKVKEKIIVRAEVKAIKAEIEKLFEVWYSNFGKAVKLGECRGKNFDLAVKSFTKFKKNERLGIVIDDDGAFFLGNKIYPSKEEVIAGL